MPDPITRLNAALEGRYRIERELGEGGMATVYLADDLKHERKVALKDTNLGGSYFYDVSADGERFLMARSYTGDNQDESPPGFVLVQNFFEELRQRVGN